ncbi:hypothetical protein J7L60_04880 [Candidatus Bathyarchaeota archaeon]|nr:hypothetical protein [Candidatus Bathyarchaeota archaeon]
MLGTGKTQEDIVAFFDNILGRKFADAERMLSSIELGLIFSKIHRPSRRRSMSKRKRQETLEYVAGYIKALEGILIAARSGDERTFLSRMSSDPGSLEKYRRSFSAFIRNKIHSPFDRGFFSAWSDFVIHQLNLLGEKKGGG